MSLPVIADFVGVFSIGRSPYCIRSMTQTEV